MGEPTKIILITPIDYQYSHCSALVFLGSRPSASPSIKQTREMRANPCKPKFPFFYFLSFSFHVSLCFSTERATTRGQRVVLTQGRKSWSVLVCRSGTLLIPTFKSSKASLWKQKAIADRNQLFTDYPKDYWPGKDLRIWTRIASHPTTGKLTLAAPFLERAIAAQFLS